MNKKGSKMTRRRHLVDAGNLDRASHRTPESVLDSYFRDYDYIRNTWLADYFDGDESNPEIDTILDECNRGFHLDHFNETLEEILGEYEEEEDASETLKASKIAKAS
jgi:hypothetical protein